MPIYFDKRQKRYFIREHYKGREYYLYKDPSTNVPFLNKISAKKAEGSFLASLGVKAEGDDKIYTEDMFAPFLAGLSAFLKPSTVYARTKLFEKWIESAFKGYLVMSMTNNDLDLINSKLNQSYQKKNSDHLISLGRRFVTYLSRMNGTLNPTRLFHFNNSSPDEHIYHIWTREQEARFLSVIKNSTHKLFFMLLCDYGFRLTECLALKYSDIDMVRGTISIKRIVSSKSFAHKQIFTTPKTKNSIRTLQLLSEIRELVPAEHKSEYLFAGKKSPVMGEMVVRRLNQHYAKMAGLEPIKMHEFRHSCASNLLAAGIPVRIVARWLGDTETTVMNFYSHLFPDEKIIIGEWMERHPVLASKNQEAPVDWA